MKTFLQLLGALAVGLVIGFLYGTHRQSQLDQAQFNSLKPDTVWIKIPVPRDSSQVHGHLSPVKDTTHHLIIGTVEHTPWVKMDSAMVVDLISIANFWVARGYTLHQAVAMQDSLTAERELRMDVPKVGAIIARYFPLMDYDLQLTVLIPAKVDSSALITHPPLVIDDGGSWWKSFGLIASATLNILLLTYVAFIHR